MTNDKLRSLVREQIEWRQVFHVLVPRAASREAMFEGQICVYVTLGQPDKSGRPPHYYIHIVSTEKVNADEYAALLKEESDRWNSLSDADRVAAGDARLGGQWQRGKLMSRLEKKGFLAH